MNKNLYKEIIKHIIFAQKYSDDAKASKDVYERRACYTKKQFEIDTALNLIKGNNIPQIRYKEISDYDQNGHMRRVIYFNIFFFGEVLQVSFHQFKRIKESSKGTHSIEWDEDIGGSRKVCKRLDMRFNYHIFDGKEVVSMI